MKLNNSFLIHSNVFMLCGIILLFIGFYMTYIYENNNIINIIIAISVHSIFISIIAFITWMIKNKFEKNKIFAFLTINNNLILIYWSLYILMMISLYIIANYFIFLCDNFRIIFICIFINRMYYNMITFITLKYCK